MRRPVLGFFPLLLILTVGLRAAMPDVSGTWKLDVQKSSWDGRPRPRAIRFTIKQDGAELAISGAATDTRGHTETFGFDITADGMPHPAPQGAITITQTGPDTLSVAWKFGRNTETSTVTVSSNAGTLTRQVVLKGPRGEQRWTEFYLRQ